MRFATALTDTPGIRQNFYQLRSVVNQVLWALSDERAGGPKATADTIDGNLKEWLES